MVAQTVIVPLFGDKQRGLSLAHPSLSTRVGRGSILPSVEFVSREWPNRCAQISFGDQLPAILLTRAQALNVIGVLEMALSKQLVGRVGSIWGIRNRVLTCSASSEPVYYIELEMDGRSLARLEAPGVNCFVDRLRAVIDAL